MSDSAIIFIKELTGNGGCIEHAEIKNLANSSKPLWFHFDANHPDILDKIHQVFPVIDAHSLDAILDLDARPRILQLDRGVLIILRGINHNEGEEPEDMVAIRLWVTDTQLISLRYRRSKAVMDVAGKLDAGKGPGTIGGIISEICTQLLAYIEVSIDQLDDQMDSLETQVLDKPGRTLRHSIAEVRKSAILLRRYVAPQRDALGQLRYINEPWITKAVTRQFQEVHDTQLRAIESLDAIRERSQVVMDELMSALSEKLNKNLYVLSVITAIFLPLGFLTGLFGINIGGMPGVENDDAFIIFSATLTTIVILQLILFKWFKWF